MQNYHCFPIIDNRRVNWGDLLAYNILSLKLKKVFDTMTFLQFIGQKRRVASENCNDENVSHKRR